MLVETAFAALVLLAWRKVRGRKGMTKERKEIYLDALEFLVDPEALRQFAAEFERDGMPIEGAMLRKRADLRAMPKEKWENFRAVAERAIQKEDADPLVLEEMASGFDAMTANGTAMKLRKRAAERRMEIIAFANEEEKKIQQAADQAERVRAQAVLDAMPPTPKNSGVVVPKDPDKTIDPADHPGEESGAHVAPVSDDKPEAARPTSP